VLEHTDVVATAGTRLDALAERAVNRVVLEWPGTIVVDADAITLFKGRLDDLAKGQAHHLPPGRGGRCSISASDVDCDSLQEERSQRPWSAHARLCLKGQLRSSARRAGASP
jgi:hypothetical protein